MRRWYCLTRMKPWPRLRIAVEIIFINAAYVLKQLFCTAQELWSPDSWSCALTTQEATWETGHKYHRPERGQCLCWEAAVPRITGRKVPDLYTTPKLVSFPVLSSQFSLGNPCPLQEHGGRATYSRQPKSHYTYPHRYLMHFISSACYAQHFITHWLLHCSGQTALLLSIKFWTWALLSRVFLGQCDEIDEKRAKQQNQEGHMQKSCSKSLSSLGETFTFCLKLYL